MISKMTNQRAHQSFGLESSDPEPLKTDEGHMEGQMVDEKDKW